MRLLPLLLIRGILTLDWQYGIDSGTCNIDTNLFKGEVLEILR
ncbi:MAG TPA: hypothetical protein VNM45_09640 [Bacillus sp. (in: firmicutes)]|nr:hypothetical protein [Bacillus sp. (in: firmicutes)]